MDYNNYENIHSLLRTRAKEHKDKVFCVFTEDKTTITYEELYKEATRIAANLDVNDKNVVIQIGRTKEAIMAYFGVLLAGGRAIFIDEQLQEEEREELIKKLSPTTIIKELPINEKEFRDEVSGEDIGIIVFTSGSTGTPKGIMSTQKNMLFAANLVVDTLSLTTKNKVYGVTPFSGTNAQIFTIMTPLYSGGTAIYHQGLFTPYTVWKNIEKHKATWMNCIPTHLIILNKKFIEKKDINYSSLQFVRTASAPLPSKVQTTFEQHYGIPVYQTMGLTETTGQVFANNQESNVPGSIGRPIHTQLRIVDEKNNDVEEGELLVKNPGLMKGYYKDLEATKQAVQNNYLRTGDIGYKDNKGHIHLIGRKKDLIIIGGKNVSPTEIEETLHKHEAVEEVCVFGIPNEIQGEEIIAAIKLQQTTTEKELKNYCKKHLATYKQPNKLYFVKQFPRGGQGKILKNKVKQEYQEK